jgi:uncharacterized protein YndB with AHSA1/START domain
MGRLWESAAEAEVNASVEQVWDAIATGPGITAWFMGHTTVRPGSDGAVDTDLGGQVMSSTVSTWDPPYRLSYRGDGPGERFIAYEYLVQARDGGGSVVRVVASGFLPQDDWEAEYDALHKGGAMYFASLVAYLDHFAGRSATVVNVSSARVTDWPTAWATLYGALGLGVDAAVGDPVHVAPPGLPTVDGVVDFVNPVALSIRTSDALYGFIQGFFGSVFIGHHLYGGDDEATAIGGWQAWLDNLYGSDEKEEQQ